MLVATQSWQQRSFAHAGARSFVLSRLMPHFNEEQEYRVLRRAGISAWEQQKIPPRETRTAESLFQTVSFSYPLKRLSSPCFFRGARIYLRARRSKGLLM